MSDRDASAPPHVEAPVDEEGRATDPRDPLAGIELAVFDKDGTLIDFHLMWRSWVDDLAARLVHSLASTTLPTGGDLASEVTDLMGVDLGTGRIRPHGLLAATPMARIRDRLAGLLLAAGIPQREVAAALDAAWHAPDPVSLARPLADLPRLFDRLAARGCAAAVATSDDRDPTERTLDALGIRRHVAAVVCADDGLPVKPAPDALLRLCSTLGVAPDRAAMIGDAPADLRMGRAAGYARVIGVLTGVGEPDDLRPLADLVIPSIRELVSAP